MAQQSSLTSFVNRLENANRVAFLKSRSRFQTVDAEFLGQISGGADRIRNAPPRFDADKITGLRVRTPNTKVRGVFHGHTDTVLGFIRK